MPDTISEPESETQPFPAPTRPERRFRFAEGIGYDPAGLMDIIRAGASSGLGVALGLNAYLAAVLAGRPEGVKTSGRSATSLEEVLRSGWAECGEREILFTELLRPLGIPTRRVGFAATPIQGGHTAVEALVDGKWRFFDPTFGLVATARDDHVPLSLGEARTRFPNVRLLTGVDTLWAGLSNQGHTLAYRELLEPSILDPKTGIEVAYPLETYFLSRALGAEIISHDNVFIPIDLTTQFSIEIGSVNGEGSDDRIGDPINTEYGRVVPMLYERLGRYFDGNVCHNLMTVVKHPTVVDVEILLRRGSSDTLFAYAEPAVLPKPDDERLLAVRKVLRSQVWPSNSVVFQFIAVPPYSMLRVLTGWDENLVKQVARYRITSRPLDEYKQAFTLIS